MLAPNLDIEFINSSHAYFTVIGVPLNALNNVRYLIDSIQLCNYLLIRFNEEIGYQI